MGIPRDNGYSATVEGFFVLGDKHLRLAKTNSRTFAVAEPYEVAPGAIDELLIIIDGSEQRRTVLLPSGIAVGQTVVRYEAVAPF